MTHSRHRSWPEHYDEEGNPKAGATFIFNKEVVIVVVVGATHTQYRFGDADTYAQVLNHVFLAGAKPYFVTPREEDYDYAPPIPGDEWLDSQKIGTKASVKITKVTSDGVYFHYTDSPVYSEFHMSLDKFMKEFFPRKTAYAEGSCAGFEGRYDHINPNHYQQGSKEVIEMMEDIWGAEAVITYCELNAFKYRMRLGHKPEQPVERDLEKARWYEKKAKSLRNKLDFFKNLHPIELPEYAYPSPDDVISIAKEHIQKLIEHPAAQAHRQGGGRMFFDIIKDALDELHEKNTQDGSDNPDSGKTPDNSGKPL